MCWMRADVTAKAPTSSLFKYMQQSGGKLPLLSLKMRGSIGQKKAGILVDLLVVMVLLVFLVVVLPLPLVPMRVIFSYRKKQSSHDSRVLLPLNLQGFIHKAPRKLRMGNIKCFCYCYR